MNEPFRPDSPRPRWREIASVKLFRLLAINLAAGIELALVMVGGLLLFDSHHLRSLILRDPSGILIVALMLFGFIVTLGSVAMGSAIMRLRENDEPPSPNGTNLGLEPRLAARLRAKRDDEGMGRRRVGTMIP